ncbi:hypothetical protein [Candidatus Poriferisodalis sp.]|uniref:hypothetical protein n=1 Tax=Candidatus Poriferisodalis sp. TaxID=3101277 RepID=UPI003B02E95A
MSEAVLARACDWMCEQADATVAEYVMSRLNAVPAAELATKDDLRAVNEDLLAAKADVGRVEGKVDALAGRVDEKFDRLVELRETDLKERAVEREADCEQRAAARKADLRQRAAEREAGRKDAGRRAAGVEDCPCAAGGGRGAVRRRRSGPGMAARLSRLTVAAPLDASAAPGSRSGHGRLCGR